MKMLKFVKEGHEVVMPADWPSRAQFEEEGYVLVEEEDPAPTEVEKTSLDHFNQHEATRVPEKVDTADNRTTLEKATPAKPL